MGYILASVLVRHSVGTPFVVMWWLVRPVMCGGIQWLGAWLLVTLEHSCGVTAVGKWLVPSWGRGRLGLSIPVASQLLDSM